MNAGGPGQPRQLRAWALVKRPGAPGRLHLVPCIVAEMWQELGAAYVYEIKAPERGHFVTFGRLASTLERAGEVVRRELGKHEKSASYEKAGGIPTQAAA